MSAIPVTTKLSVRGCDITLMRGGAGRPMVILHGASGAHWLPVMTDLAGRHDVLAPEHPGFGARMSGIGHASRERNCPCL